MLSSTYNKVPYSILQNEVTKSFNNYISSGKHEYVKQIFIYMSILVLKKKLPAQWFDTLQAV